MFGEIGGLLGDSLGFLGIGPPSDDEILAEGRAQAQRHIAEVDAITQSQGKDAGLRAINSKIAEYKAFQQGKTGVNFQKQQIKLDAFYQYKNNLLGTRTQSVSSPSVKTEQKQTSSEENSNGSIKQILTLIIGYFAVKKFL